MHSEQRQPQGRPGFRIQMGKNGTGSYDLVLKKIELLHRYGVEYNILTVVHGRNVNAVEEIYEDYKRRGWRYLQFIACLEPLEGTRDGQEYSLHPEEYGRRNYFCRAYQMLFEAGYERMCEVAAHISGFLK